MNAVCEVRPAYAAAGHRQGAARWSRHCLTLHPRPKAATPFLGLALMIGSRRLKAARGGEWRPGAGLVPASPHGHGRADVPACASRGVTPPPAAPEIARVPRPCLDLMSMNYFYRDEVALGQGNR